MILGDIADGVTRSTEKVSDALSATFLEPRLRIGVTGLSRAGKTVFITSLVANLLERDRLHGLSAVAEGRILSAYLQPQPDDTVPRFDFETHLAALTGPDPYWPKSTRSVSQLRLSLRIKPGGLLAGLQAPRTLHLDIVDYPGEWLLDLELLDQDFTTWSNKTLSRIAKRQEAEAFLALANSTDGNADFEEPVAQSLSSAFATYLSNASAAGHNDCTPGRFLLPGELEGSPVLTFAPLPKPETPKRSGLWHEMERRFDAYKRQVVKPFFRDHFAKIDRQVVLIDTLGALAKGPEATEDLRRAMGDILASFRPGRNGYLSWLLRGKRVEKILFAATKADHLHQSQHDRLTAIMQALVKDAKSRADYAGADTSALAIASLRTTVEETRSHNGKTLNMVRGRLENGKQAAFHPGELPKDPNRIIAPARDGAATWAHGNYQGMQFAPAEIELRPGEGPPHIWLDKALQFLIGDRL